MLQRPDSALLSAFVTEIQSHGFARLFHFPRECRQR